MRAVSQGLVQPGGGVSVTAEKRRMLNKRGREGESRSRHGPTEGTGMGRETQAWDTGW